MIGKFRCFSSDRQSTGPTLLNNWMSCLMIGFEDVVAVFQLQQLLLSFQIKTILPDCPEGTNQGT